MALNLGLKRRSTQEGPINAILKTGKNKSQENLQTGLAKLLKGVTDMFAPRLEKRLQYLFNSFSPDGYVRRALLRGFSKILAARRVLVVCTVGSARLPSPSVFACSWVCPGSTVGLVNSGSSVRCVRRMLGFPIRPDAYT